MLVRFSPSATEVFLSLDAVASILHFAVLLIFADGLRLFGKSFDMVLAAANMLTRNLLAIESGNSDSSSRFLVAVTGDEPAYIADRAAVLTDFHGIIWPTIEYNKPVKANVPGTDNLCLGGVVEDCFAAGEGLHYEVMYTTEGTILVYYEPINFSLAVMPHLYCVYLYTLILPSSYQLSS